MDAWVQGGRRGWGGGRSTHTSAVDHAAYGWRVRNRQAYEGSMLAGQVHTGRMGLALGHCGSWANPSAACSWTPTCIRADQALQVSHADIQATRMLAQSWLPSRWCHQARLVQLCHGCGCCGHPAGSAAHQSGSMSQSGSLRWFSHPEVGVKAVGSALGHACGLPVPAARLE